MTIRHSVAILLIGLPGAGSIAGCAGLHLYRSEKQPAPIVIEAPKEMGWTATTWEAASTPKYRKELNQAHPKTIIGEVVDVSCYLQLGKRGEAHIPCGQKCVRNGQPIGIVTSHEHLYLLFIEEHHPRRDGQVSLKDRFAELIGKRVQVSGMATTTDGYRALFVRTLPTEQ